ncbi:MAG: glycosyltransferase family 4 protein [Sedimenticola sp.]
MKILFIFEHYAPPFDEGIKNFAHMVGTTLANDHEIRIASDITSIPTLFNRLLLIPRLFLIASSWRPDRIVYIPEGALTFFGCLKAWILGKLFLHRISTVNVQKRELLSWQKTIIKKLHITGVFSLSASMATGLEKINIKSQVIYAGIDRDRFSPGDNLTVLKNRIGIPDDRPVILHVGHIRKSRNIEWLKEIQENCPRVQTVLVGSTTTTQESSLARQLEESGVIVIKETLPAIQAVYQIATWYLFPVILSDAAMEIPLSVLEAMSTNLPIITTPFGQLPDLFTEDRYFKYVDNLNDVLAILMEEAPINCNNREKTQDFTWHRTAQLLIE